MEENNIKAVIFDFDYTLADSSRGVVLCIRYAFNRMKLKQVSEEVRKTIGLSLPETFKRLTGDDDLQNIDLFFRLFAEQADRIMANNTVLFPGIKESLKQLKAAGFRLGILSTKFRYRIENILDREELLVFFDCITGGEDVEKHKPDPEGFYKPIRILELDADDLLYVGDSLTYAETARAAGVRFCASLSGTTAKQDFSGYAAEFLLILRPGFRK